MPDPNRQTDPFFTARQVASTQECTGLMPVLPDAEQDEAYAELYAIHDAEDV